MAMTRTTRMRSRGGQQAADTTAPIDDDWARSGAAGIQQAEAENQKAIERAQQRAQGIMDQNDIWRYRLTPGEEGEIIVLDAKIEDLRFYHEHNLQDSQGKWRLHELCPKEWETCPICEGVAGGRESYYVMYVSILDLRGYTSSRSGEFVAFTKRLLPVKNSQINDFVRLFDAATQQFGTFRGLHLALARDASTPYSIGKPVMLTDEAMFEVLTEEELAEEYGGEAVISEDGTQVIKAENADITPYPYALIFKKPSAEDLRRRYGGQAPAGSRQANQGEWGSGSEWGSGAPQGGQQQTQRTGTRMRTRQTAAPQQQAQPVQQGRMRPRGPAAQPGATEAAPRTRTRTRVQPGASGARAVPNDLDDKIPF